MWNFHVFVSFGLLRKKSSSSCVFLVPFFPLFPPSLTRGLWALGIASGKTDLKATTPCRDLHFLEEHLRLRVCEDTLAITLPPHIIIFEMSSLSASEKSLTWSVVWSLSSTALFEKGSCYNGSHMRLSSGSRTDLSAPFPTGCKIQISSYKQLV